MLQRVWLGAIVVAALAGARCGGSTAPPTSPPAPSALQISGVPSQPLTVGQRVNLRATATSDSGTIDVTAAATWRTSNAAVAVVSLVGALTATGTGQADVQVTYQGLSASSGVRVEPRPATDDRFKVAVLAMDARGNPPAPDVERVFARAAALFSTKTGVNLAMVDFASVSPGSPLDAARTYVDGLGPDTAMPDGLLALSNDGTAVTFGGYSQTFALPPSHVNTFPSPYRPPTVGYLAVQDYFHIYARCGYDSQGNRVRDRSANGECRNQSNLMCVNNGRNWVCPNTLGDLYAEDDYFAACTIVHELSHPFGPLGNQDHYGTAECSARTGMSQAQATDHRLFQESCGLCPDVYNNVRR